MAEHTPGPWRFWQNTDGILYISGDEWEDIATLGFSPKGVGTEAGENGERIVACVNACEGINPEAVPDLLEACQAGKAYFDLLYNNMSDPDSWSSARTLEGDDLDTLFNRWRELSNTAIAKAKGDHDGQVD